MTDDLDSLDVLNGQGHLTLRWNPKDPADVARAREEVARLKAQGYTFFAVIGATGSDEIEAGNGTLLVERIDDPIRPAPPQPPAATAPPEEPTPPKKGKGGRRNVAVRPMAGG